MNGNSIFLPSAGRYMNSEWRNSGGYWTASLLEHGDGYDWTNAKTFDGFDNRGYGMPVRAVK